MAKRYEAGTEIAVEDGAQTLSKFPVRPDWADFLAASLLGILVCLVYGPIAWHMIHGQSDSRWHVMFAQHLIETHSVSGPHVLYALLVAGVFRTGLVPSFEAAGLLVLLPFYALTAVAIYGLLFSVFQEQRKFVRVTIVSLAAAAAILVEPLSRSSQYNIGYFWPTTYDSPTSTLTKPLSLISFILTGWFLAHGRSRRNWIWGIFATCTAAAALSKPSFIICLVPAAGLMACIRLIRGSSLSFRSLLAGLFVPAAVVLGLQYYETYSGHTSVVDYRDSIVWAPLVVMRYFSSQLVLKLFLSITFPLIVFGLYWNRARRDVTLMLAWLSFWIASFYAYMLAEKLHATAGNFLWSGYLAAFILFVASITFWLGLLAEQRKNSWFWARFYLCAAVLALHAVSGALVTWNYCKSFG